LWEVVLQRGDFMNSEAERTTIMQHAPHAESLVLYCDCGEKMVIFGRVEDWLPRDPIFKCDCGEVLIFSENAKDEYYSSFKAS
jgi:hypothetical protein